eukprot:scaffold157191_cov54-Attheya_sp.AAC.1
MASVVGPSCNSCAPPGSPAIDCHGEEPTGTCIAKGVPDEITKETMCTKDDEVTWYKGSIEELEESSCVDGSEIKFRSHSYNEEQDETTFEYKIETNKDKQHAFTGATFAWAGDCCITRYESELGMLMESGFDDQSCLYGAKFTKPQYVHDSDKHTITFTMMGNVGRARATVALNFGGEEVYSCLAAVVGPSCEICYDPEDLAFDYVIEFDTDDPFDEYAQETIASSFTKAYSVVYNDAGIRITTSMVEGQFEEDSDGNNKN